MVLSFIHKLTNNLQASGGKGATVRLIPEGDAVTAHHRVCPRHRLHRSGEQKAATRPQSSRDATDQ